MSLHRNLMFPLLAINRCRACMNKFISMLHVDSVCTALLTKHVKSSPYLLTSFVPSIIRNGPNISLPKLVNGGPSNVLSFSQSAIFCCPSLPCSNWHMTLSYQTSDSSTASNYPKTITSDFIHDKPLSSMCHFLVAPLYSQPGDVTIFTR